MKHILWILMILFWGQAAPAHFIVDTQNREIHIVESEEAGTMAILRFPLTLAYANELAQRAPGAEFSAPYMKTEMVRGGTYYRLDIGKTTKNPRGFADFLLRDFRFSLHDIPIDPDKAEFVVIDTHATEEDAASLKSGLVTSQALLERRAAGIPDSPYISDTLIVLSFRLPDVGPTEPLKIELHSAAFPVPEGKYFETRIADHRDGNTKLLTFKGASFAPVTLAGSLASSFTHFIKQGVYHILTGYDHVLFVLCLVMAVAGLRSLVWSVTGFTLGHSITLAAGVVGLVPQGGWFVPLIELLVATSILLMGALILLRRAGQHGFWLAGTIGLLHGFGFSFLLADMMGGAGDALAVALAGFNIGVELGQLVIVSASFLLLLIAARFSEFLRNTLRYGVAAVACVIALVMIVERSEILTKTLEKTETL